MGQPPASPSHIKGRPLGHMLPGQPFSEIAMGYCLFLGRPPPRPYLAWLHLMTIRYTSEGMKASHSVRHQDPHCVACPSQQVSPSPPGISLWLRTLCSQVSDMTERMRTSTLTNLSPSYFIPESQVTGMLNKITWPTLRKWCLWKQICVP